MNFTKIKLILFANLIFMGLRGSDAFDTLKLIVDNLITADDFTALFSTLEPAIFNNLGLLEYFLNKIGRVSYFDLIRQSYLDKRDLLEICRLRAPALDLRAQGCLQTPTDLAKIERELRRGGLPYRVLINTKLVDKLYYFDPSVKGMKLSTDLSRFMKSAETNRGISIAPIIPLISPGPALPRAATEFVCNRGGVDLWSSQKSLANKKLSRVFSLSLQDITYNFPFLGKYFGAGYRFDQSNVIFENSYPDWQAKVPANIQTVLRGQGIAPADVDFYVRLSTWQDGPFADKDGIFNLIYHGAVRDWYLPDDWNFNDNNFSANLPMGIFDPEGLQVWGDLTPFNNLKGLLVNPHNNHLSPDNAQFRPLPERHLVSFWSLALSDPGIANKDGRRHAVLSYNIFIDGEQYRDWVRAHFKPTIKRFMEEGHCDPYDFVYAMQRLDKAGLIGGDRIGWEHALQVLNNLYRS